MTGSTPVNPPGRRSDSILTAAIASVAVLVLALLFVLWSGAHIYAETVELRAITRASRNELIAFTQSQSDAHALQRDFLLAGDRSLLRAFRTSLGEARSHRVAIRPIIHGDTASLALLDRIDALSEQQFALLETDIARRPRAPSSDPHASELANALDDAIAALHASLLRRVDAVSRHEEASRARLDTVAVALALLSLVVCGLSVLALRRERSQWRLATEAAEDARAKAAAADLAKTRFLAVASHDMRQPLHALTLYLSALQRRMDNPEARDIITKMDRATQSMVGMFSTLLDLARIQAGVVNPEIATFPLQDVIDRVLAEHAAGGVEAARTNVVLRSDPVLLERLLSNLTSNAIKHGGGKARIEVTQSGDHADIIVADDGPGIAEEDQARIYEEFTRLGTRSEGLGLGLAIVKRIAGMLDMPLKLESAPGRGARFTLTAPVVRADGGTLTRPHRETRLNGATVLVMDDDQLARDAIGDVIRDLGAIVTTCEGRDAVHRALDNGAAPMLLVMDLRIDGALCGIEIAESARARLDPPPPVLMVTGDTGPEALAALRASGFAWLIKPVDPRSLAEAAATQLRPFSLT